MENLTLVEEEPALDSQIVYIKPFTQGTSSGYAIHASDGKPLGVFDSYDSAFFAARMHDLAPMSVH